MMCTTFEMFVLDFDKWAPILFSFIGIVISIAILVIDVQLEFGIIFLCVSVSFFFIFTLHRSYCTNKNYYPSNILACLLYLVFIIPFIVAIIGLVKSQEKFGQNLLFANNILFLTVMGVCPILYSTLEYILSSMLWLDQYCYQTGGKCCKISSTRNCTVSPPSTEIDNDKSVQKV